MAISHLVLRYQMIANIKHK